MTPSVPCEAIDDRENDLHSIGDLPMRVVINGWFWDRPDTGTGQYTKHIARLLSELGEKAPDVTVVIPTGQSPDGAPSHDDFTTDRLKLIRHPIRITHLSKVWWEQILIPRIARQLKADLLHIPYWAPPAGTWGPTVVTIHDLIPLTLSAYRGNPMARLYTSLVAASTPGATLVITDSEASRHDIVNTLPVSPDRVQVIPLAVDDSFSPAAGESDRSIRHDWGISEGYLLYLGGFDIRKNLATMLRAFTYVSRAVDDAQLVIAGRLPQKDSTFTPDPRRLAKEMGIPDRSLHFLGYVPESHKPALYRGAKVFLFPSRYEGFGYPPLEALSCGVPVVGSNAASLPEVVGAAGMLTDPDDAEGMAGAVIQLLIDEQFHTRLSRRAMEQARRFTWTRTARLTMEAYRAALTV